MENQAPYGVTMLVVPPSIYSALDDALTTTLESLAQTAAEAGLPHLRLETSATLEAGHLTTHLSVLARYANWRGRGWQVEATGRTLAEAEQDFYAKLSKWQAAQQPDADRAADAAIAYAKEGEAAQ